jgi:hypothetical protein
LKATKYPKGSIAQLPPTKKTDGRRDRKNLGKENIIAQHLEKKFRPNPGPDIIPAFNSKDYLDKIPLLTPKEVAKEIRNNINSKRHLNFISSDVKLI